MLNIGGTSRDGARRPALRLMTGDEPAPPVTPPLISVYGQQIRVEVRAGTGVPLVLCNGIGASLEVLDPLVAQLDPASTIIRFDVPGAGGSPGSPLPYGFPYLAAMLGRLLKKLGYWDQVDVLGYSWGGALAQQFALQNPRRCRRVILAATGTGVLMVPGKPRVLAKMLTPQRFFDQEYAASVAAELYGGAARDDASVVKRLLGRQLMAGSRLGYLHQLLAGSVWTSMFTLPAIRQPTLILAGTDDPIIPPTNAALMARLMPRAEVHLHSGGHLDMITNAAEFAPIIDAFRAAGEDTIDPAGEDTIDPAGQETVDL
jgi:poly(3-hydroxyalkanoate) depolymerase